MKTIIGGILGTVVSMGVIAAPVQVTYSTGPSPSLFLDSTYTTPVPSGSYAELIVLTSATYDHDQFASYVVLTTCGYGTPFNLDHFYVGTGATGATTFGDGKVGIKWLNTQYGTSYYIAIRFYNNPDKNYATAYGVMTPYKLTKDGSPSGIPTFESKVYSAPTYLYWTQYPLTPIPEPASLALVGLGGLALVLRRKVRKEA